MRCEKCEKTVETACKVPNCCILIIIVLCEARGRFQQVLWKPLVGLVCSGG